MDSVGLVMLPEEVIQNLANYLSVQDVLSCSLTCHYLRAALNSNCVWKRFLPEGITCLESLEQLVAPKFQQGHSLTPLCDNRVHFMRKTHLKNNWTEECFVAYDVQALHFHVTFSNRTFSKGQIIYKDKYLFVSCFIDDCESYAIEVWDITKVPVMHTSIKIDYLYNSFYIVDFYLVVVECCKVDVYEIRLPEKEFPLVYSFLVTDEVVTVNEHVSHPADKRCVYWTHSFTGKYLVSYPNHKHECLLHVWDIVNALKLGSILSPVGGDSFTLHFQDAHYWILEQTHQDSYDKYFFKFNVSKKEFCNVFKYEGKPTHHIMFYKSNVIVFRSTDKCNSLGWFDRECLMYDFDTSVELRKRQFNNGNRNLNHHAVQPTTVINGTFVILCLEGFQVIDALTLETVNHFQCDNVRYIHRYFNRLGSVFVTAANCDGRLEVWDMQKRKKMPKYLYHDDWTSHIYLSELCTKLVYLDWDVIGVVHFW